MSDEMTIEKVIETLKESCKFKSDADCIRLKLNDAIVYLETLDNRCDGCKWLDKVCYYKKSCDQHRASKEASE